MSRWLEFSREVRIGDSASLEAVADALFSWDLHRRAGLLVLDPAPAASAASSASLDPVVAGAQVRLQWRCGPIRVNAPVEVVDVRSSARDRGFTYRALAGHPEAGEETFLVEQRPDGVWFRISARSRPATWWARAAGPVTRWVQGSITAGYLRAAEEIGAEAGPS